MIKARDHVENMLVAIKITNPTERGRRGAQKELQTLRALQGNDPKNKYRCVQIRDWFDVEGHICIVMDLLGPTLSDVLVQKLPFVLEQIGIIAHELFTTLSCMYGLALHVLSCVC